MRAYFGGSFDPPHLAHHQILSALLSDPIVSYVHVVPTFQNPLKHQNDWSHVAERREWIKSWIEKIGSNKVIVEWEEMMSPQNHYTVDTLSELKKKYPTDDWALCVGADVCGSFLYWKDPQRLFGLLKEIWIFPRGCLVDPLTLVSNELKDRVKFRVIPVKVGDVSSTLIRDLKRKGQDVTALLAPGVLLSH